MVSFSCKILHVYHNLFSFTNDLILLYKSKSGLYLSTLHVTLCVAFWSEWSKCSFIILASSELILIFAIPYVYFVVKFSSCYPTIPTIISLLGIIPSILWRVALYVFTVTWFAGHNKEASKQVAEHTPESSCIICPHSEHSYSGFVSQGGVDPHAFGVSVLIWFDFVITILCSCLI